MSGRGKDLPRRVEDLLGAFSEPNPLLGSTPVSGSPPTRPNPPGGRLPPQAVEVEQAILGALLTSREAIPKAIEILPPRAFYHPGHRWIYQAIMELFERGDPVDLITVQEELRRQGRLEEVGGVAYLAGLTAQVASSVHVEYHARIVLEKAILRELISLGSHIAQRAFEEDADPFQLLDQAEQEIFQLSAAGMRRPAQRMNDVLKETLERLEALHGRDGGVTGVPSGFHKLDELTAGWQPSDLIIVAARPSMGKTSFVLSAVRNAALHPRKPTAAVIFSLEMSATQIAQRLLCAEARVDAQALRTGKLHDDEWPRLARAAGVLSRAKIFIDDTPSMNVLELRAKCRRLKNEHDIGLIVLDYLQLMHGLRGAQSREQEIAQISRSLKALAKELDVPVIAISQLSRAVELRADKRPQLSDLRESGSIEQDADVVLFIYRAERYGVKVDERGNPTEGIAELIVGKQRNGPVGTVYLAFIDQYARFENLDTIYASYPGSPPANAPF
ncbi:MAG: replicative DNA helicase [Bacteroidota bacterium]|nr:replicative DNA helicase [Bacteroidota bacterium]MDW8137516.1 replicative DNA helicase [Bacteroidota bacterium]